MAKLISVARTEKQREIVKLFETLQGRHNLWRLWEDFVTMTACTISNTVFPALREEREKLHMKICSAYSRDEMKLFSHICLGWAAADCTNGAVVEKRARQRLHKTKIRGKWLYGI